MHHRFCLIHLITQKCIHLKTDWLQYIWDVKLISSELNIKVRDAVAQDFTSISLNSASTKFGATVQALAQLLVTTVFLQWKQKGEESFCLHFVFIHETNKLSPKAMEYLLPTLSSFPL